MPAEARAVSGWAAEIEIQRVQLVEQTIEKRTLLNESKERLLGCRDHLNRVCVLAQPFEERPLLFVWGG